MGNTVHSGGQLSIVNAEPFMEDDLAHFLLQSPAGEILKELEVSTCYR